MSKAVWTMLVLVMASFTGCLSSEPEEMCKAETILEEGSYYDCAFKLLTDEVSIWWDFEYKDGTSNVDIFFMDDLNFNQYEEGNAFVVVSQLSREDVKSTHIEETSIELEEDETYHFVVDHTGAGEAQPDWGDDVWFKVVITMERA